MRPAARATRRAATPHTTAGAVDRSFGVVIDGTREVDNIAALVAVGPMAVLRERERMAADLRETVIQRLFATSRQLASLIAEHPCCRGPDRRRG
jgi:signal transduction histidine kinase